MHIWHQENHHLGIKLGTMDYYKRVNMRFVWIVVVNAWMALKKCKGDRNTLLQDEFYKTLSEWVIDNCLDNL